MSFSGGLQEYTMVDARYAAVRPKNISDLDAALNPINAVTSAVALFAETNLGIPFLGSLEGNNFDYTSKKPVIFGGGTNCEKLAIVPARIAGIGSIIVTAGLAGAAELKSYGATHVIDRRASDAAEQIRTLVGDELVYIYDTISTGAALHETVQAQKTAGFEEQHVFGASGANPAAAVYLWDKLPEWIESGEVKFLKYSVIEGLDEAKINAVFDEYRDQKRVTGESVHVHLA